ncbi:fibronectin type III domain-containing protein [Paenibacillus sp. sgz500958]|uniref:fibronectin type III domain-containing protein n=1 Tax=Paenibacillus sp. sgz500958 TaxID=3242475 RepID=UPI0036D4055A
MKKYSLLSGIIVLLFLFYSLTALAEKKDTELSTSQSQVESSKSVTENVTPTPSMQPIPSFPSTISPNSMAAKEPSATPMPSIKSQYAKASSNSVNALAATGVPTITGVKTNQNTISWNVSYITSGVYGNRLEMYNSKLGWVDISKTYYTTNGSYSVSNLDFGTYMGRLTYLSNGSWVTVDQWIELADTPKIERVKSTNNSITWKVIYPASGVYGDRLEMYSTVGGWVDISKTYYTVNGEYTSTNLTPNVYYMGRLTYLSSLEGKWYTVDLQVLTNQLSQPVNLTFAKTNNSVKLNWSEPLDTRGQLLKYKIYNNNVLIGTTDHLNYTYDVVKSGTYIFSVSAFDSTGESLKSNSVTMQQNNNSLKYVYKNGRLDYIVLSSTTKLVFQYDQNGNLLKKVIMPL